MKKNPYLSIDTKLKAQWIKNLNIREVTPHLVEENLGKSLELIGTGQNFLNGTLRAQAVRSRIDKWDVIKQKIFCKTKDIVNRTKHQSTERMFIHTTSKRGLI